MNIELNLNDIVSVQLTEHGKKIFVDYWHNWTDNPLKKLKNENELQTSLWELFSIFGPHINLGSTEVFKPLDITFVK